YVLGGARAIGFVPSSLANPDLKWETTNGIDLGADVTVLGSRVTFTADYYSKKTHDLLLDARVPSSSGFGSSVQNIGSVRNRGFELSLNSVNLTGGCARSEEHTSELQSRGHLVCRLLLEKKK